VIRTIDHAAGASDRIVRDPVVGAECGEGLRPALLACCRFRGHEDKVVTMELESGYDETEVQPCDLALFNLAIDRKRRGFDLFTI
jgi:hypothetical protein